MEIEFLIRQGPRTGRFASEHKSLYVELPAIPNKGDDVFLNRDGGQTYTVVSVCHEFAVVSDDPGELHVGRVVVTITPKGIV